MTISGITTTAISSLGSNSSLFPIFVKDTANSAGISYIFYKHGGKHEGKEKAIEEFGTQVIWLGGIPFLKKLTDLTAYKIAKINPSVDIRKFKESALDNINDAIDRLPKGNKQREILEKTLKDQKLTKGLFLGKWLFSTFATLAALGALISYKQKTTDESIKKEFFSKKILNDNISSSAKNFMGRFQKEKEKKDLSFGSAGTFLSGFMYNPVMNMSLLEGGIFYKRAEKSREGELGEVVFKELFFITFLYPATYPIRIALEKLAQKMFDTPVALKYKALASGKIDNELANDIKKLKDTWSAEALKEFMKKPDEKPNPEAIKELGKKIIKFVHENPENKLVQVLIDSEEVRLYENSVHKLLHKMDTLIDSGKVKFFQNSLRKLVQKLKKRTNFDEAKFHKSAKEIDALSYMSPKNITKVIKDVEEMLGHTEKMTPEAAKAFVKKAARIKAGTILTNIGIAVAALGVAQSFIIIQSRKMRNGNTDNPAIKVREEQMRNEIAYCGSKNKKI